MHKIASFIVDKRFYIMGFMLVLTLFSAFLMPRVEVNYDMADYLPVDSETTLGLEAMEEEFGRTGTAEVMLLDVSAEEAHDVAEEIGDFDDVQFVTFDEHSPEHYIRARGGTALLQVTIDADDYSPDAEQVVLDIKDVVEDYNAYLAGPSVANYELQEAVLSELPWIMVLAVSIVLGILLLTSRSWLEPAVFIVVVTMAIIINMGTNYFLSDVSYITQSVAAVLQLGLSMNYSIILLNRYHQERERFTNNIDAMKEALARSIAPISSSSLTTVAGMLALTFMTFEIGLDLGVVLAKGILLSLISVFLVLPGLLLVSSRILDKTRKRTINLRGGPFTRFSLKGRKLLPVLTVIIFFAAFAVQTTNEYFFADEPDIEGADEIEAMFGRSEPVTATIETHDDVFEEQEAFIESLEDYEIDGDRVLKGQASYVATALAPLDTMDVAEMAGMDETMAGALFGLYHLEHGYIEEDSVAVRDMVAFLDAHADEAPLDEALDEETRDFIAEFAVLKDEIDEDYTIEEAAAFLEMSEIEMLFLYWAYHSDDYDPDEALMQQAAALATDLLIGDFDGTETIELGELILFIDELDDEGAITLSEDERETMDALVPFIESVDESYDYQEAAQQIEDADEDFFKLLYSFYFAEEAGISEETIRAKDLLMFIEGEIENNEILQDFVDEDVRDMLDHALDELAFAEEMFAGESYTRMILTLEIDSEGEDAFDLVEFMRSEGEEIFSEEAYFAGTVISNYDIADAFDEDLLRISLITVGAIVLLVGLTFRSYTLPFILVMIIQGAIWMSMGFNALIGEPIFFMTYIVVTAIQMGATVDYGILISSSYLELRNHYGKSDALKLAVNRSLPTVFTSGLILITAGLAVGIVSSQMAIYSVGYLLARGAAVSVVFVLLLLPAVLHFLDAILEKTTMNKDFKSD